MSPFSSPCIIGWHRPAAVLPALAPPRAPRPLPCPSLPCSPAPEKRRTPPAPRPCRHLPPPAPLQLTQHLQQLRRRPPGRTAFLSRLAALPAPTALHGKGRGGDVTRRRGRVRQGTAAARSLSAPRRRPAQLLAPSHEPAGGSLKSESEIRVTLAPLGPVTDWSSEYNTQTAAATATAPQAARPWTGTCPLGPAPRTAGSTETGCRRLPSESSESSVSFEYPSHPCHSNIRVVRVVRVIRVIRVRVIRVI